jgi:8-oxo-dGTP pyrophosphatase MutT (NUDIX family)
MYPLELRKQRPDNSPNPWQTLTNEVAYDNKWIQVTHRTVTNPAGGPGIYGVVHFKNTAIGILPLDEHLHTWIVGQYRYTIGQYTWEIPEGGGPEGSSILASAQRELLEETGMTAKKWTPLVEIHTSNSVTDEYGMAFVAQELSFGTAQPEETEDLRVRRLPFAELVDMVLCGEITDSLSMIAVLKANEMLRRGLL